MNYSFFILLFFVLSSCKDWKSNAFLYTKGQIPKVYYPICAADITIKNGIVFKGDKPYNGFLYEIDTLSKDTVSIVSYLNGKEEGITQKFYSKQHLKEQRFYSDGQKNGAQVAYWENGHKKFEFVAKDDRYEGVMKEWTIDGQLNHLAHFKNGQEEGEQKFWYENGKIKANYIIINGKRYGLLGTKNCKNVSDSIFVVQ
jgi:antitoxin component YwqK of YwqJK toxin-antitoxin module